MRAIYAAHLNFAAGTSADDVLSVASAWPCRGQAKEECARWEVGVRTFEKETDDFGQHVRHQVTVEGVQTPDGRLSQTIWKHPHADDTDLMMVNDMTVVELDGAVSASLVIGTSWVRPQVSMPRYSMRAPRLVRDLLDRFVVRDGQHRLRRSAHRLDAAHAEEFVEGLLLDRDRTRPVVFVSDDSTAMQPLVDPRELAAELAGMAHVYYSSYGYPSALVSRNLGSALGARGGAMRIWWPQLTRSSNPYDHRLYTGHSLRNWHGPNTPVEALFRVVSVASATNAEPAAYASLRRSARRAALDATTDAEELTELAEQALADNDRLTESLRDVEDRVQTALVERDEALQALDQAREDKRRADKAYAMAATQDRRTADEDDDEEADEPAEPPKDVLEAVQQAQPQCPHLDFADRAFESAAECPYEYPQDILEDLLLLERLAALWARPEGIGGMDLAAKAGELGLTWKPGVSNTTTGGTRARQYEFTWRGEQRRVGPHTRRDKGKGAGRIARIYLDKYEPAEPRQRRLIVGVVGRKLDDSTTG